MKTGLRRLLIVLAALSLVGCSSKTKPTAPVLSSGGWLAGWVMCGLSNQGTIVDVYRVKPGPTAQVADVWAESGHFAVPLPPGNYVVAAQLLRLGPHVYLGATGPTFVPAQAETLVIPETPADTVRADFVLGAITVSIKVPHAPDGLTMAVLADWIRPDGTLDSNDGIEEDNVRVVSDQLDCTLVNVPAGRYLLRFGRLGDFWSPGVHDPSKADTIRVGSNGLAVAYDATLQTSPGWIQGQVAGNWRVWSGGMITVLAMNPDSVLVGYGYGDVDGYFTIELPQESEVRLHVEAPDGSCWIGGHRFSDATRFAVPPGDTTHVPPWGSGGLRVHLDYDGTPESVSPTLHIVDSEGDSTA